MSFFGSNSNSTATIRAKVEGAASAAAELEKVKQAVRDVNTETRRSTTAAGEAERGWSAWSRAVRWLESGAIVYSVFNLARSVERAAVNVVQTGLAFNSMQENSRIAFTTLLGSAAAARDMLKQLFDLAAHTPFTLVNVQQAAQTLLAMGFSAQRIVPMLRSISNLIAANPTLGADAVPRLAVVLGQIRSAGRLMGQDALQLVQFGFDPYKIVADTIGKTRAQVLKLGQEGKLNGQQVVDAILNYADRRFKGLAAAQSHTYSGLVSTLQDVSSQLAGSITAPAMPAIERNLEDFTNFLQRPSTTRSILNFEMSIVAVGRSLAPFEEGIVKTSVALSRVLSPSVAELARSALPPLISLLDFGGTLLGKFSDDARGAQLIVGPLTGGLEVLSVNFRLLNDVLRITHNDLGVMRGIWEWFTHHTALRLLLRLEGPWSTAQSVLGRLGGIGKVAAINAIGGPVGVGAYVTERAVGAALGGGGGSATQPSVAPTSQATAAAAFGTVIVPVHIDGTKVGEAIATIAERRKHRG